MDADHERPRQRQLADVGEVRGEPCAALLDRSAALAHRCEVVGRHAAGLQDHARIRLEQAHGVRRPPDPLVLGHQVLVRVDDGQSGEFVVEPCGRQCPCRPILAPIGGAGYTGNAGFEPTTSGSGGQRSIQLS